MMIGLLSIAGTVLIYLGARRLYAFRRAVLLTPILVGPLAVALVLVASHVPYSAYMTGGGWLSRLLGPATVAFAVPMHKHVRLLKQHAVAMVASVVLGSGVALVTSVGLAAWARLSPTLVGSLAPRSVTTPIAMAIARTVGGDPTMAAVFVIVTAVVGLVVGPLLIRWLPIRTPVARGVLFGMGAHGAGTARAFEMGQVEGTASSLAMILAAGATLLLTPMLFPLLKGLL